eukprot:TRINITY_DN78304_c0_g1_i1.p1 TRINITY_DN78304_c0_g1~~TRINITY_DN78304_c0_g1_i1.p1  ORF type:complete len:1016 (-),score=215.33 TRINITY_DN78304_c0_g1_i1:13-2943(-)
MDPWEACCSTADLYSRSASLGTLTTTARDSQSIAESGPSALWLLPCLESNCSSAEREAGLCRRLRRLAGTHAARALAVDEPSTCAAGLAAVAWRVLPRLRSYLQEPERCLPPLPVMHLASHLVCAVCTSRPPSLLFGAQGEAPAIAELSGDMSHIVTTLVLTLVALLAIRSLTPTSGLWAGQDDTSQDDARAAADLLEAELSRAQFLEEGEEDPDAESGRKPPPDWEPLVWQGLRVLLEQLKGTTAEQRRLLRSGALPSLVAALFLQPSSAEAASAAAQEGELGPASTSLANASEEAALASLAASSGSPLGESMRALIGCLIAELSLERLASLLGGIRRRPAPGTVNPSGGHWITAWYEALLGSLRRLLWCHVRTQVLRAARDVSSNFERLPLALCAPEARLSAVLATVAGCKSSRSQFLALWRQLNGTRRLQLLFAHHPRLTLPSTLLPRRRTVLWRGGSGATLRFVCADRSISSGALRLAVHAHGSTWELHAGHAARWAAGAKSADSDMSEASAEAPRPRFEAQVEPYALAALATGTSSSSTSSPSSTFDMQAELLMGGACCREALLDSSEQGAVADRAPDVAHFLATLRLPVSTSGAGVMDPSAAAATAAAAARGLGGGGAGLLCAAAHPSRPVFAAACEDGSVQLWAFGQRQPLRQLPRPSEGGTVSHRSREGAAGAGSTATSGGTARSGGDAVATAAAAAAAAAAAPALSSVVVEAAQPGRCALAWSPAGNRLLAVGGSSASNGLTIWTVGEGQSDCRACALHTGAAHSKLLCATFASTAGGVVATAGRRADTDGIAMGLPGQASPLKAWPYVAAGICVWDTLAPRASALVSHDATADASPSGMPAEYSCLAWAPSQQRLLCGTKAGELRVFDLRMQRLAQRFEAHSDPVKYCFVLESSAQLVTLSSAAEMKIWSLKNLELLDALPKLHSSGRGVGSVLGGSSKALSSAALLSEQHIVTCGQDGNLVLTRL